MFRKYAWVLSLVAVAMIAGAVFSGQATGADNAYVGDDATKCAMCHKAQVDAWKTWDMAKAWSTLQAAKDKKQACEKCHVTGAGKPGGFVSFDKTPKLVNVQCEACHGPAGDHMKVPLTDKAKKKATMQKPTEATCKQCHTPTGNPHFKDFKFEDAKKKLANHFPKK